MSADGVLLQDLPEGEACAVANDDTAGTDSEAWSYVFVGRRGLDAAESRIGKAFRTFVHRSMTVERDENRVRRTVQPTIPGLLFIQGRHERISRFLETNFIGLRLARDLATGRPAVIGHGEMERFMRLAMASGRGIRMLSKPLEYYAADNRRVRITSGILEGMEGYIVRISRSKRLVMQMGNMTIAVDGAHTDTWEEA